MVQELTRMGKGGSDRYAGAYFDLCEGIQLASNLGLAFGGVGGEIVYELRYEDVLWCKQKVRFISS